MLGRPLVSVFDTYTLRVKWMETHDKWRDQFDQSVTKITPQESIQTRVAAVAAKTKETPISYQVARVIGTVRNHIVPLLPELLNKDGYIPTGKGVPDVQEGVRVA